MRKRRHRLPLPSDQADLIDVSPLVDVAFLLLIFFLVTSTILKRESDLETRLPSDPERAQLSIETLVVDIAIESSGSVSFGGSVLSTSPRDHKLAALVEELSLSKELAATAGQFIIARIEASDEVRHQRFTDVLNALAAAGIETIAIEGGT